MTTEDLRAAGAAVRAASAALSQARSKRDALILTAHHAGLTDGEIAAAVGLDKSRVTIILQGAVGWRGQGRRKRG